MSFVFHRRPASFIIFCAFAAVLVSCDSGSKKKIADSADGYQLRPGLIVDPHRAIAFVMTPERGIDAIDLDTGTQVWTTVEAARPLVLVNSLLIAQTEPSDRAAELEIVTLDTAREGERIASGSITLPDTVQSSIDQKLESSFDVNAYASAGEVFISWKHTVSPMRGVLWEDQATPGQGPDPSSKSMKPTDTSGIFRMTIESGEVSPVSQNEAPAMPDPQALDVTGSDRLADISGTQFLSADGHYVMSSQRIANDSVWLKYKWTIFDRRTSEKLGESKMPTSWAAFTIIDSRLIYETGPYLRRVGKEIVEEPLKLRAIDLSTGQELWSRAVRDTAFRGPAPP